ncbi:kinase-like protein [Lophiostoma macrostomum CBS 122681]|uniref:non-specific serine/threonine protein kinase n=1 Tax=Lophiostoma macrostomum CBS 122681 TaxID=1314788 RepID=A0A6A6TKK9_9PLEO|nr:kinase-like protein [Lophiostoma macrostomum CBS 122681]
MFGEVLVCATIQPSFEILKWIGGGGFGQVFKVLRNNQIVACKQVLTDDKEFALAEHTHMTLVRGGPHIVAVHDDVEWNSSTKTLSFFMDYHKGKHLDRLVNMLAAAGHRFTEVQIIDIAYQIAVALEYCHSKNILHQDMKPMNVLLEKPWNPLLESDVPNIYVTDFGIASHVRTLGTRFTGQRGTPPYEAPEIRGQDCLAAFSQKSDVYAFGCVLYRLCTLRDPDQAAGLKPSEISQDYSIDLLSLVSSMLSYDRVDRPTASEVKDMLLTIARTTISTASQECRTCKRVLFSSNQLRKHLKETGHSRKSDLYRTDEQMTILQRPAPETSVDGEAEFKIKGIAELPSSKMTNTESKHSPCAVCLRQFKSKGKFFQHLHY